MIDIAQHRNQIGHFNNVGRICSRIYTLSEKIAKFSYKQVMETIFNSFTELIRLNSDSVTASQPKLFRGYAKSANIVQTQQKRRNKLWQCIYHFQEEPDKLHQNLELRN